jgi:hypothetical protein
LKFLMNDASRLKKPRPRTPLRPALPGRMFLRLHRRRPTGAVCGTAARQALTSQ